MSGSYSAMRHNELRAFTASVLQEVCKDVALEPPLQPLGVGQSLKKLKYTSINQSKKQLRRSANATQEARLDISVRGQG